VKTDHLPTLEDLKIGERFIIIVEGGDEPIRAEKTLYQKIAPREITRGNGPVMTHNAQRVTKRETCLIGPQTPVARIV
jgi:hypothetical protein